MPIRNVPYWLDRFPKSRRPSYPRFHGNLRDDRRDRRRRPDGLRLRVVLRGGRREGRAARSGRHRRRRDDAGAGARARRLRRLLSGDRRRCTACDRRGRCGRRCGARRSIFRPRSAGSQIKCDLAPADLLIFTRRDADAARQLQREYQGRRAAGLDHSWVTPAALARETGARRRRARSGRAAPRSIRIARAWRLRRPPRPRRRALREVSRPPDPRRPEAGRDHDRRGHRPRRHGADRDRRPARRPAGAAAASQGHGTATRSSPNRCRRRSAATSAAGRLPCATARRRRTSSAGCATTVSCFPGPTSPKSRRARRDKALVQRTGQLMYELSTLYPADFGTPTRVGLGFRALRNRGSPAVCGAAPQFSAPLVRDGRRPPRRGLCVAGRPDTSAPAPGRGRQGRRAVRVHPGALKAPAVKISVELTAMQVAEPATTPNATRRPRRAASSRSSTSCAAPASARAARSWTTTRTSASRGRRPSPGQLRNGPGRRRQLIGRPGYVADYGPRRVPAPDEHHRRAPALAVPHGPHAAGRSRRR